MNNQVIEVLNKEHGQEVKKYWESRGVDTTRYNFIFTRENKGESRYYGVINGKFGCYTPHFIAWNNCQIIESLEQETPEQLPIPRMVMVRNLDNKSWNKRELLADLTQYNVDKSFICRANTGDNPIPWRYMKEVHQEITKDEAEKMLSELKGIEIKIK